MKTLKKPFIAVFLIMSIISWPAISSSQEWSSEQQEVLAVTEKMLDYWAERDLEGYMSCLHDNFMGWFGPDPFPNTKETLRETESQTLMNQKIHHYRFKPISVTITDNVAIVNLYYIAIREDENGKITNNTKATETYIKKNGEWLMLAWSLARVTID